jgi:hypothetical protein
MQAECEPEADAEAWQAHCRNVVAMEGTVVGETEIEQEAIVVGETAPRIESELEGIVVETELESEATGAPAFVAAATYAGRRPGYVFKTGPAGLGYYIDAGPDPTYVGPVHVGPVHTGGGAGGCCIVM